MAGSDWHDLTFYATHGEFIDRIAIVAEPKWRDLTLMFAQPASVARLSSSSPRVLARRISRCSG